MEVECNAQWRWYSGDEVARLGTVEVRQSGGEARGQRDGRWKPVVCGYTCGGGDGAHRLGQHGVGLSEHLLDQNPCERVRHRTTKDHACTKGNLSA